MSIFQLEVYAIESCIVPTENGHTERQRALGSYEVKQKRVWHCLGKLSEIVRENRITLCWVRGCVLIRGNVQADQLKCWRQNFSAKGKQVSGAIYSTKG